MCSHKVLLQLLARRLPLPNLLDSAEATSITQATEMLHQVLRQLQGWHADVPEMSASEPIGQEWAATQLSIVSGLAIDIMSFLECGAYNSSHPDDADTQSMASDGDYRPGQARLRNHPGFQPHMLTKHSPSLSNAASGGHELPMGSLATPCPLPADHTYGTTVAPRGDALDLPASALPGRDRGVRQTGLLPNSTGLPGSVPGMSCVAPEGPLQQAQGSQRFDAAPGMMEGMKDTTIVIGDTLEYANTEDEYAREGCDDVETEATDSGRGKRDTRRGARKAKGRRV